MTYGHFDDHAREYVIERPDTPLPWINYLGNADYVAIVSNTAGGYSFHRDARLRRLTRYRYNGVPPDLGGRYLYVRDAGTGDFWSPSWLPVGADVQDYRCRHGLGYSVIGSRRAGIEAETVYFVPLDSTLEIWRTRIVNHRREEARLSLFSAVEFCLWDAWDDATNFQRNLSIGEVEVEGAVVYHKSEYRERRNHFAYFACSGDVAGFDTDRNAFLGPHRGWDRPLAVEEDRSRNSIAHGWAPCGSHRMELVLEPGETREIVHVLGYAENPPDAKFDPPGSQTIDKRSVLPLIERFRDAGEVEAALAELQGHWSDLLAALVVETPDDHVNRIVNVWNSYQCMTTFNLSRSASLFESGIGRGMGFRDSNQDLLGFVHLVPGRSRTAPRPRGHPASLGRRLPPVPAADQAGQRRDRPGLQRRPAVARPRGRRLSEGDRRCHGSLGAGPLRQRARLGDAALRASAPGAPLHAGTARPARTAADRAGGLERLPQPEPVLGDAGRVVPDRAAARGRRRRIGVHRRALRPRRRRARRPRRPSRRRGRSGTLPRRGRRDGQDGAP